MCYSQWQHDSKLTWNFLFASAVPREVRQLNGFESETLSVDQTKL